MAASKASKQSILDWEKPVDGFESRPVRKIHLENIKKPLIVRLEAFFIYDFPEIFNFLICTVINSGINASGCPTH
jgi:hypothetical protein